MQCCIIFDSYSLFQDGFKEMITLSLEENVIQQKYKVLSFAIVAALYIFLVPSTSHAQTHVPNTLAGEKACRGSSWTLGCDMIPLNGRPATAAVCEELYGPGKLMYDIIQATGGNCHYYIAGTSSGRGGPNMWSYPAPPRTAECHRRHSMGQLPCEPPTRWTGPRIKGLNDVLYWR